MAFEPGQSGIREDGTKGRAETGRQASETDFNWIGIKDGAEFQREEVEHRIEVHAWVGTIVSLLYLQWRAEVCILPAMKAMP